MLVASASVPSFGSEKSTSYTNDPWALVTAAINKIQDTDKRDTIKDITATAISTCEITDSDIPPFYLGQRAYVEGKVVWLPGFTGTITGWFYNDGVLDIY